jgi:uncharacterized protein (TIGR01777 family)
MDASDSSSPAGTAAGTILVTGATGFVGTHLVRALRADGRRVIVLSRDPARARARLGEGVAAVDRLDEIASSTALDGIVNLAGARVIGPPWTDGRRRELRESRLSVIAAVVELMKRLERTPAVLVGASAVGWYGALPVADRPPGAPPAGEPQDERSPPRPGQFQSDLCVAIEQALQRAERPGVRVVRLRPGVVMGRGGGAYPQLALGARLGFGAVLGTGRQAAPWIHVDDVVGLIRFALAHPTLAGPVNAVAPDLRTQAEFARALAASFGRGIWVHVPAAPMRLALGEMSELLLEGQNVVPHVALDAGYVFEFPTMERAFADLARAN